MKKKINKKQMLMSACLLNGIIHCISFFYLMDFISKTIRLEFANWQFIIGLGVVICLCLINYRLINNFRYVWRLK